MRKNDNDYIEYLCNKPRKLGTRFYDEDYLALEEEEEVEEVDYQTKCCHQDQNGQKRKFVLHFGIPNDECEESPDTLRCKDFWEFVDSEPILSNLIKDGHFLHSNKPTISGPCSMTKLPDSSLDPIELENYRRVQDNKAREREILRKRREKTKMLQLKSGQTPFEMVPCIEETKTDKIFSYQIPDNLDEELASMREYDAELSMKQLLKDNRLQSWHGSEEYPGEDGELGITEETILRQSVIKDTLDAKAALAAAKAQLIYNKFRSASSELSGEESESCRIKRDFNEGNDKNYRNIGSAKEKCR